MAHHWVLLLTSTTVTPLAPIARTRRGNKPVDVGLYVCVCVCDSYHGNSYLPMLSYQGEVDPNTTCNGTSTSNVKAQALTWSSATYHILVSGSVMVM